MGTSAETQVKTIAVVRIAVGLLFILFGQFKAFGPEFMGGMMRQYVERYVGQDQAVGFYKLFLANVVLPHSEFFALVVGWGELFLGLGLVVGLWVRAASVAGGLHMLSLTLASWHAPGSGAPLWTYFAGQLDHLGLLFLFVIFFAADAGRVWGLDTLRRRKRKPG